MSRFISALTAVVVLLIVVPSVSAQGLQSLAEEATKGSKKPSTPVKEVPVAAEGPVKVQTRLSRTAVWPGDPFTYTIEITCPPGSDILTEDLGRDRLRLQGLDLSTSEVVQQTRPDGAVVHTAKYSLASYSTDETPLKIDSIRVRYYIRQPGQRIENMTQAGEVVVPATEIAMRSTLPDGEPSGIRDAKPPMLLPSLVTFLRPVGLVAIALSFAPVALGVAAFVARRRASRGRRRVRRRPEQNRAALEEIRSLDGSSSTTRIEAFDRLDGLVRDYLSDLDVAAHSMTPDEAQTRVSEKYPQMPADVVVSILRDCQRARYGGPAQLPDVATLGRALDQTGELFAARAR